MAGSTRHAEPAWRTVQYVCSCSNQEESSQEDKRPNISRVAARHEHTAIHGCLCPACINPPPCASSPGLQAQIRARAAESQLAVCCHGWHHSARQEHIREPVEGEADRCRGEKLQQDWSCTQVASLRRALCSADAKHFCLLVMHALLLLMHSTW